MPDAARGRNADAKVREGGEDMKDKFGKKACCTVVVRVWGYCHWLPLQVFTWRGRRSRGSCLVEYVAVGWND